MRLKITPEEEKNGWTQRSLDEYRRSRNRQQAIAIFKPKEVKRPVTQNHAYNPLKWRR